MIYNRVNYLSDIKYLTNTYITEYDISKANINILFSKGIIDKKTYEYLYNSERMVRQVFVGKLQKNQEVVKALQSGIVEAKRLFFEANAIQDHEVLSIKNDAVYIINRKVDYTDFGLVKFADKNKYTSYYRLKNMMYDLEFYYYYNYYNKEEILDIKGASEKQKKDHDKYLIQFFKDIFYTVQVNGIDIALRMLKDFYLQYINLLLDIEYYREFNIASLFHYKHMSNINTGFKIDNISKQDINIIDITYNLSFIIELQKTLMCIYYANH